MLNNTISRSHFKENKVKELINGKFKGEKLRKFGDVKQEEKSWKKQLKRK